MRFENNSKHRTEMEQFFGFAYQGDGLGCDQIQGTYPPHTMIEADF